MLQVKVCGITQQQQANALLQLPIEWIGFIFYKKSPRYVMQPISIHSTNKHIVGVFVNPTNEEIDDAIQKIPAIKTLQLHGNETVDFCTIYKKNYTIIKAIAISNDTNINEVTRPYEAVVDYFLFDTKVATYGGSGKQFNWKKLVEYTGEKPFLLSGGIGYDDVITIQQMEHSKLIGVDVNSKFETAPGVKDIALVQKFAESLRS